MKIDSYDGEIYDAEQFADFDSEDMALAAHSFMKDRARKRRNEAAKHSGEAVQYKKKRKKLEEELGHIGTSFHELLDKTSDQQIIDEQLKSYDIKTVDEWEDTQGDSEAKRIIKKYEDVFEYLGASTEITPNVVTEYEKIEGKKERLGFFANASLADKAAILCGSSTFSNKNIDAFEQALRFNKDYIDGRLHEGYYMEDDGNVEEPWWKYVESNLGSTTLRAAMLGTPEYAAYIAAHNNLPQENHLPKILNTYGFFACFMNWQNIIDGYELVSEYVKLRNPNESRDELEHKTVLAVSDIFKKAANSKFDGIRWLDRISFAMMPDEYTRKKYEGVAAASSVSMNFSNVNRFIDKDDRRDIARRKNLRAKWKHASEACNNTTADDMEKVNRDAITLLNKQSEDEIARIEQKYARKISKTRDEKRQASYRERCESEKAEVLRGTQEKRAYYERRSIDEYRSELKKEMDGYDHEMEKTKPLAEKAIDLAFALNGGVPNSDDVDSVGLDWVNNVPFGTITRSYRKLMEGVPRETIAREALGEIISRGVDDKENFDDVLGKELIKQDPFSGFASHVSDAIEYLQKHNQRVSCKRMADLLNYFEKRYRVGADFSTEDRFGYEIEDYDNLREAFGVEYLGKICTLLDMPNVKRAAELGMSTDCIINHPWLLYELGAESRDREEQALAFPANQSEKAKYDWCFKNCSPQMRGGEWGRQSIGKIIYSRLQAGRDYSIEGVGMLLDTFQIPEYACNIARMKEAISSNSGDMKPDDYQMRLYSSSDEDNFLRQIIYASSETRSRLKLSQKEQNIRMLFHSPVNAFLYREIAKIYRDSSFSLEKLYDQINSKKDDFYREYLALEGKGESIDRSAFYAKIDEVLSQPPSNDERIGEVMQRLMNYGRNRKAYVDDATGWLTRHSMMPANDIISAWKGRDFALSVGLEDSVSNINSHSGFMRWFDENPDALERGGFKSRREFFEEYMPFIKELGRVYDPKSVFDGICIYKNLHNPEKIMPPETLALNSAGEKKCTGVVLSHDDPRGMTIGPDTGCCMRLGKESHSCIESGYRDKNAGFFALYDTSDKLMAQSYFYISEGRPDVVVMDNIEANAGRDSGRIVSLYSQFFKKYLLERFATDPDWKIRQVNVGTRYGKVAEAQVKMLKSTEKIYNDDSDIYSDARQDQRLLIRLTDEEIAQARAGILPEISVVEKQVINHDAELEASPLTEAHLPIVSYLEERMYPENMRQYGNEDFTYSEITRPTADKYSFIMDACVDSSRDPAGYCIAYEEPSRTNPDFRGKTVYVADFGILPEVRDFSTAMKMFDELLKRAEANGAELIEMDARESTSYRLFSNPIVKRALARRGYEVTDHGFSEDFGGGEATYLMSIRKVAAVAENEAPADGAQPELAFA